MNINLKEPFEIEDQILRRMETKDDLTMIERLGLERYVKEFFEQFIGTGPDFNGFTNNSDGINMLASWEWDGKVINDFKLTTNHRIVMNTLTYPDEDEREVVYFLN